MATETIYGAAPVAGEAATKGMPQLDFATYPNQIFWLALTLIAVWWVLSRVALPRIGAVLAERSGTITNDLATAEELSLKVKSAETAYQQALVEARTEAGKIVAAARADIQGDLDAATAKADEQIAARTAQSEKEIGAIRDSAADAVREVARQTAAEILSAMGMTADAGQIDAAVAERAKG